MKFQVCSRTLILKKLPWVWVTCTVRQLCLTWWTQEKSRPSGNHHPGSAQDSPTLEACGSKLLWGPPLSLLWLNGALNLPPPLPSPSQALHPWLESPEGRDGHLLDPSLALGWRGSPSHLGTQASVLVSKLAGAFSLVRDATELPVRGLGAQGRAAKQGEALSLLEPTGFWMHELPGVIASLGGFCGGGQQRVVDSKHRLWC